MSADAQPARTIPTEPQGDHSPLGDRNPTRIDFAPPKLQFVIKGKLAHERPLSELRRVYLVQTGPIALGGEHEFTVLEFPNALWIIPNLSPLPLAFGPWREHLQSAGGYFEATLDELPESWQGRILGFRSAYRPRPAEVPLASLPTWNLHGPLPLGKIPT